MIVIAMVIMIVMMMVVMIIFPLLLSNRTSAIVKEKGSPRSIGDVPTTKVDPPVSLMHPQGQRRIRGHLNQQIYV